MAIESVFASTIKWAQKSGLTYESFDQIGSTNSYVKQKAFSDSTFAYIADYQTQGRGRGVNSWNDSGKGQSLALSLKFTLAQAPQPILSPLVGLALYGAAAHAFPALNFSIKPPNDLYLDSKKVAGLLIETVAKGSEYCLIIGLGMNILSAPQGVDVATSLCGAFGLSGRLEEAAWFEFLSAFHKMLERYIPFCLAGLLPAPEKTTLLKALNSYPLIREPYTDLTSDGDLFTKSSKVSWKEL